MIDVASCGSDVRLAIFVSGSIAMDEWKRSNAELDRKGAFSDHGC